MQRLARTAELAARIRPATGHDWRRIEELLLNASLPLQGARDHLEAFVVADVGGALLACGGLERYRRVALLRSVAVDPSVRGRGLGELIVSELIDRARGAGFESVHLLTTTAAAWFPRFGFRQLEGATAPGELSESAEFRGACPSSATFMSLTLI